MSAPKKQKFCEVGIIDEHTEKVVLKAFDSANSGEYSLAELARECRWLAFRVASVFVSRRGGRNWREASELQVYRDFSEESERERRGDYDDEGSDYCEETA